MNAPGGGSGGRSTTGNGGAPGGKGGSSTGGSGTGGSGSGTGGAGTGGASTGGSGGSASGGGGSSAGEGGSAAGEGGSATGGQGGSGDANGAGGTNGAGGSGGTGGVGGTNGSGGSGGTNGTGGGGTGGGGTGGTNGTGGGGTGGGGSGGGGTPVLDVERYELKGAFNWATEALEAEVTITLAPAAIGLASAALDIDRPKLTVKSVRTPTGAALPFSTTNSKLNVNLAGQFPAGQPPVMVVAYDAVATGDALAAVPAKTGGPSDARVAFTQSEPLGVDQWMPCHNDPADRAYFAADMVVPAGEMLIANGDLVADEPAGAGRRMAYATSYTLPTYLMAFAAGGFAVESAVGPHGLPLAIWHRQGAGGDYAAMLFELGRLVAHFESLLGVPYPFEKYAVVSLPQFSAGGIEHAGITFQRESVSTNPASTSSDLATTAHELGHQWFGDMVTVLTWDDLWIKEGMATVLQSEGTRAYLDESGSGTLNGDNFSATDGQAIRDVALPPEQKYTSGPYGRAAWLLTQIRTLVGEQAFWGALKRVLTKHAYGNVGTDEFLEEFRADLGEAAYAKAKSAVDAKDVYAVQVLPPASPGGPPRATVVDAEGSLVAPMRAEWRRDDGTVDALTLAPGQQVELVREAPGDLLVLDPADAHIDWPLSSSSSNNFGLHVAPMLRPSTASALARFVALPGVHQYASLSYDWAPEPPEGFAGFLAALDSEHAAATALTAACERATQPGPAAAAWRTAVTGVIGSMPGYRGSSALPREACAEAADVASIFAAEWAKMAANPLDPSVPEGHLVYLAPLWAGLPPALARGSFGAVAYGGRSAHERGLAATTLRSFVLAFSGQLTGAERTAWRAMATPIVAESRLVEVLPAMFTVIGNVGGAAAENAAARAAIAQVLHDSVRAELNLVRPVCAARKLSSGDLSAWNAFVTSLQDVGDPNLQSAVQSVSQNPANACAPYFGGVSLAPSPDGPLARKLAAERLEGKARRQGL